MTPRFKRPDTRSIVRIASVIALASLLVLWWAARPKPLPDFTAFETVDAKKQAFFEYVRSRVTAANEAVLADRRRLEELRAELDAEGSLSWFDKRWLYDLAERYEVSRDTTSELDIEQDFESWPATELIAALLPRVDIVPESLALVQAAKESGWGTARFAVEGKNLFGQQCFEEGCGLMPEERAAGRRHEVADFDSVQASVDAYVHNLNTHPRYAKFRVIRARQRGSRPLSGTALADGLMAYSERGQDYIDEVKAMIRQNDLE